MNKRGMYRTLPPAVKPRKQVKPPMPISRPGFAILVPLELVPEYLKVNGLKPKAYNETTDTLIVTPAKEGHSPSLAGVKKTGAKGE